MQSKSWFHIFGGMHYPLVGADESHFICVQTSDDMLNGRASSSGAHFGAVIWSGPGERAQFEARENVRGLGHVHENLPLPADVVASLAAYGVQSGHGLRDALKLIIAKSGVVTLALGEL